MCVSYSVTQVKTQLDEKYVSPKMMVLIGLGSQIRTPDLLLSSSVFYQQACHRGSTSFGQQPFARQTFGQRTQHKETCCPINY